MDHIARSPVTAPAATSERRRAANRANAEKSTGPRTAAGKARVAMNGCRHGLNRPVGRDPAFAGDVEAWARKICALPATPTADERSDPRLGHKLHLARRIAQAQVDIIRIRRARHAMLAGAFENPSYRSWRGNRARIEMLGQVVELRRLGIPLPDEMVQAFHFRHQGVEKYALILADCSRELFAFDRYERRALSRRKFAIRAFDEAQLTPVAAQTASLMAAIDAALPVALDPAADRSPKRGKRRRLPEVSSPSPLVGEGRGGGSGGCDEHVTHSPTPTPDPSPQGGGEKKARAAACDRPAARLPDSMGIPPPPPRPWGRAPGGEGTVAFWRSKAKEAKPQFRMNACAKARAEAASPAGKGGSLSPREAVRRIFKIFWKDDLPEGAPEWLLAERACRPP
jgi:hypothetical protein